MHRTISVVLLCAWAGFAQAHEMVPTYPKMSYSHISGVVKTTVQLFNKREEIQYYELGVFDESFFPVPFVTPLKVLKVPYLTHASADIYIRQRDVDRAVYICSESKLLRDAELKTRIASRICSKIKK